MGRPLILMITAALTACGPSAQRAEIVDDGSRTSAADQNKPDPNAAAVPVDATPSDCTPRSCPELRWKLEVVDPQSGGVLEGAKGWINQLLAWGVRISSPEKSPRRALVKVEQTPSELQTATKANTAIVAGAFAKPTAGSFTVRYRDVDRCRVKLKAKNCDDITAELEDADERATISYQIQLSPADQALTDAERRTKEAKTKAVAAQCIGGFIGSITGNLGGLAGCAGSAIGSAL